MDVVPKSKHREWKMMKITTRRGNMKLCHRFEKSATKNAQDSASVSNRLCSRATMNNWKIRDAVSSNIEGRRQREAETGYRRLWSPSNCRQRPQESRNFEGNGYSNLSAALMMQRCRNFMILLFLNT
jgi:hypothetical protein